MKEITSTENRFYKRAALLRLRKYREKYQLFVVEGPRAITTVIDHGIRDLEIWISDEFNRERYSKLWQMISDGENKIHLISSKMFTNICDTENSQGILAIVKEANLPEFDKEQNRGQIVVLDGVQDPGNAGTLVRVAAAVNCSAVFTTKGTVDLFNAKSVRGSMGTIVCLPIIQSKKPEDIVHFARNKKLPIIATALHKSTDYSEMTGYKKFVWVFGNEAVGISDSLLKYADKCYRIPLANSIESLNVGIAAGIFLYHNKFLLGQGNE